MVICRSQPRKAKFSMVYPDYAKEKDIVEFQIIDVIKSTGEGETDFIIEKKLVESSRVDRQKFLEEQSKGHSIYQIIDKIILTGDYGLLGKQADSGIYGDFSKLPQDRADAYANHMAVIDALSKLDPTLVGEDLFKFLKEVTPEDIAKFYAAKDAPKAEEGGAE